MDIRSNISNLDPSEVGQLIKQRRLMISSVF